jgi:hypothetical protein
MRLTARASAARQALQAAARPVSFFLSDWSFMVVFSRL